MSKRVMLGHCEIGERATLYFFREDSWTYPSIDLDVGNGESASFSLQHMSAKKIHKAADELKRIAFLLENPKPLLPQGISGQGSAKEVSTSEVAYTDRIKNTDGYCDTCGDMYVLGYEQQHSTCKKQSPAS